MILNLHYTEIQKSCPEEMELPILIGHTVTNGNHHFSSCAKYAELQVLEMFLSSGQKQIKFSQLLHLTNASTNLHEMRSTLDNIENIC